MVRVRERTDKVGRVQLRGVELLRAQRLPEYDGVDPGEVGDCPGVEILSDEQRGGVVVGVEGRQAQAGTLAPHHVAVGYGLYIFSFAGCYFKRIISNHNLSAMIVGEELLHIIVADLSGVNLIIFRVDAGEVGIEVLNDKQYIGVSSHNCGTRILCILSYAGCSLKRIDNLTAMRERRRKGRECKIQNNTHRTIHQRNTLMPVLSVK